MRRDSRLLSALTVIVAAIYLVAAILHLGARVALGPVVLAFPAPIPSAAVVESMIGLALAAGATALALGVRPARTISWAAYLFALVGTLFGLSIGLVRGLPAPDIWVHLVMLIGLGCGFVLLLAGQPQRDGAVGR